MNFLINTAPSRPAPKTDAGSTAANRISYTIADSEMGPVLIAGSTKGVCAILFGEGEDELTADLAHRFPKSTLVPGAAFLQADVAKILRYIANPSQGLNLALDPHGTAFQRRVWQRLQTIPVGETISYADLARQLAPASHPRAVAGACAANPIALAIPCHRVVSSTGKLTGYRWGIERKRELLRLEAAA